MWEQVYTSMDAIQLRPVCKSSWHISRILQAQWEYSLHSNNCATNQSFLYYLSAYHWKYLYLIELIFDRKMKIVSTTLSIKYTWYLAYIFIQKVLCEMNSAKCEWWEPNLEQKQSYLFRVLRWEWAWCDVERVGQAVDWEEGRSAVGRCIKDIVFKREEGRI